LSFGIRRRADSQMRINVSREKNLGCLHLHVEYRPSVSSEILIHIYQTARRRKPADRNVDNSSRKTVTSQHVQLPVQGRKLILYSVLMAERGSVGIQGVLEGTVNILGGGGMDYSK